MYRRHFVSVMLCVIMTLTTTSVVAAEASSAVANYKSTTQPETVLVSFELPMIPSTSSAPSPVVKAQQSRAYLTRVSSNEKAMAYLAAVNADELAAARAAEEAQTTLAEQAVHNGMFTCIRTAESGDNYGITSGAYGILISTWNAFSSVWKPYGNWSVPGQAPPAVQDLVAYHLYEVGGGYGGWHDPCTQ